MGRVDICRNRVWHRVCLLLKEIALVVCRQLGYSPHGKYLITVFIIIFFQGYTVVKETFAAPTVPSYRGYIYCRSKNSSSIEDCELVEAGELTRCNGDTDYGVICQGRIYGNVQPSCLHTQRLLLDTATVHMVTLGWWEDVH